MEWLNERKAPMEWISLIIKEMNESNPPMKQMNEMTPQGHRGKPIQQLFFLWARSAPSKKKIIAEMDYGRPTAGAAQPTLISLSPFNQKSLIDWSGEIELIDKVN